MKYDGKIVTVNINGKTNTATIRGIGKKQLQEVMKKMQPRRKWILTIEAKASMVMVRLGNSIVPAKPRGKSAGHSIMG